MPKLIPIISIKKELLFDIVPNREKRLGHQPKCSWKRHRQTLDDEFGHMRLVNTGEKWVRIVLKIEDSTSIP